MKKDDRSCSKRCHKSGVVFLNSRLRGCSAWTSGQGITSITRVLSTCISKMKPKKHIEGRCLSSRQWKMSDSAQSKNATTWFWRQFAIIQNQKLGISLDLVTIRKIISWVTIEERQWEIIMMDGLAPKDSSNWNLIVDQRTSATWLADRKSPHMDEFTQGGKRKLVWNYIAFII